MGTIFLLIAICLIFLMKDIIGRILLLFLPIIVGAVIGWIVGNAKGGSSGGVIFFVVGGFLGMLLIPLYMNIIESIEDAHERRRQEALNKESQRRWNEEQLKQKELERQQKLKQDTINRARALSNISGLVSDAQMSAAKLPLILSDAELWLDQAENEFSEGVYSPFWEAMEGAVQSLSEFNKAIRNIEDVRQRYSLEAPSLAPDVVSFSLGITILPNPSATNLRMKALYRQAQKDPHFAQIYEQRRTNAILVEGFRSLGDALTSLGDRIESELCSLGDVIGFHLSDLESALRNSNEQMGKQHEALLQAAQLWREEARSGNAELIAVARSNAEQAEKDARERREYETTTQNMLDNIQRRRKPLWPNVGSDDY